ncbi:MAG: DUF4373 domain-containing protein [Paenibacillaceae bacterium]|nr:DUF4373 domain-containing protein [Paenibacillaceae bacterium]
MRSESNGRLWWLQLQFAFFQDKKVRALRRKFGDLALIIYQKMMLKSLENNCYMKFEGLEDTFEEEIAIDISEDEAEKTELIKKVMNFLIGHELMIEQEEGSFFFPQAAKMSGSEGSSAERMRQKREREKATSQCDASMSNSDDIITRTKTDTDLHLKSNKSKTLDVKSKTDTEQAVFDSVDRQAASAAAKAEPPAGDLFSIKQLEVIVTKNKVNLTQEGIKEFYDQMQDDRWTLYSKPIERKTILRALRAYAKHHPEYAPESEKEVESKHAPKEIIDTEIPLEEKREKQRVEQDETQRILSDPVAFEQWINEEFGEE